MKTLQAIWKDPVFSKVIAGIILAVLALAWSTKAAWMEYMWHIDANINVTTLVLCVLIAGLVVIAIGRNVLLRKRSVMPSQQAPYHPFNTYWLGHDLLWTKNRLSENAEPVKIAHGLAQALHHTRTMGLSDASLSGKLEQLIEQVERTKLLDWNTSYRIELDNQINLLMGSLERHFQNSSR